MVKARCAVYADRAHVVAVANDCNDFANAAGFTFVAQGIQQQTANALTAGMVCDIDGIFGGEAVGRAGFEPVGIGVT